MKGTVLVVSRRYFVSVGDISLDFQSKIYPTEIKYVFTWSVTNCVYR
jgi:hypothetical protein